MTSAPGTPDSTRAPGRTGPKGAAVTEELGYTVVIERTENNYGAYVPDLPGCVALRDTEEEVLSLVEEGIAIHLEELRRDGLPVPPPTTRATVVVPSRAA